MKAIIIKRLGPTDTKPARWKAIAEGVPHRVFGIDNTTPRQAAEALCEEHGWGKDLIEGHLPDGGFVFVFARREDTDLRIAGRKLFEAYEDRGYGIGEEVTEFELALGLSEGVAK